MSPSDSKIAVTGAGGFIGSHLVHNLLLEGHEVRALVHYNALGAIGHLAEVLRRGASDCEEWERSNRLEIVQGDIQDARCVREFIHDCDQVMHLAALIGIPYSYRSPASYVNVNTLGTLNVLEAAREECPERVIVTSTSEVYGTARSTPINERHLLQAQSPYSASKVGADKLAESYALSFDLPLVTVRPFNTFGPRQSTRAIVPTILAQLLSPDCEHLHLGALTPVRDLVYVEDTVQAYMQIAAAPIEAVSGRLYNIATGEGMSIRELADLSQALFKTKKPIVCAEERVRPQGSEVEKLIGDSTRLRKEIGWKPNVGIEDGLMRTARWIERNLKNIDVKKYGV